MHDSKKKRVVLSDGAPHVNVVTSSLPVQELALQGMVPIMPSTILRSDVSV
jgi:hypothetical protein